MAKNKFSITKALQDVKTKKTYLSFNTEKQVFEGSALVRGDDYDPGDGNYPQLRISILPSTVKAYLDLTPELLSNTEYRWFDITWDPRDEYVLDTSVGLAVICGVYDEDGTIGGGQTFSDFVDLSPPSTVLTPLADIIQPDGSNGFTLEFQPKYVAWMQKFKPKVMKSLKEDMSAPELAGYSTHFSLKTKPTTWYAVDVAGGDFIKTLGDTPFGRATIEWDETDVYWDEIHSIKTSLVDIDEHDSTTIPTGTEVFYSIDYQAVLF
tara:strand:- start:13659 stop:14453 length:795 start_codon:yes stop_codon:yes gene_type:complete